MVYQTKTANGPGLALYSYKLHNNFTQLSQYCIIYSHHTIIMQPSLQNTSEINGTTIKLHYSEFKKNSQTILDRTTVFLNPNTNWTLYNGKQNRKECEMALKTTVMKLHTRNPVHVRLMAI